MRVSAHAARTMFLQAWLSDLYTDGCVTLPLPLPLRDDEQPLLKDVRPFTDLDRVS